MSIETSEAGGTRIKPRRTGYFGYIVVAVVIAVIAWAVVPVYMDKEVQARVARAIAVADGPKAKIAEYVAARGKLPDQPGEVDPGKFGNEPDLGELRVEPGGKIRLLLAGPDLFGAWNVKGKSIVFTPVVTAGRITEWQCSSDVRDAYLLPPCRKR